MKKHIAFLFLLIGLISQAQTPREMTAYYNWLNGAIFGDTVKVTSMGTSADWHYQILENAFLLDVESNANFIRNVAGINESIDIGILDNTTPGSTIGLTPQARLVIDEELDASSIASSGSGTQSDPYVIRDLAFRNGAATTDSCGFFWNDPDATYYIKLINCKVTGYADAQICVNTGSELIIDSLTLIGSTTVAGAETAKGISHISGKLTVTNSRFDNLGNYSIRSNSDHCFSIRNAVFLSDSGTATGVQPYAIFRYGTGLDTSLIRNCLHQDSTANGFFSAVSPHYMLVEKNELTEFNETLTTRVISLDAPSTNLDPFALPKIFRQNQCIDDTLSFFIFVRGGEIRNVQIYSNHSEYYPTFNKQVIAIKASVAEDCYVARNYNDQIEIRGLAKNSFSEPVIIEGALNCVIEQNYTKISQGDGYELFNPRSGNRVLNNVIDTCEGQIADVFTSQSKRDYEQFDNVIANVYGVSLENGVLVTDSRGFTVKNAFVQTTNIIDYQGDTVSAVKFEQRNFAPDTVPSNCFFVGGSLPSSYQATGHVFLFSGSYPTNKNSAFWIDQNVVYTYNVGKFTQDFITSLDTARTYTDGVFTVYELTRRIAPSSSAFYTNQIKDITGSSYATRYQVDVVAAEGGNLKTQSAISSSVQQVKDANTSTASAHVLSTEVSGWQYGNISTAGDVRTLNTNYIRELTSVSNFNDTIWIGGVDQNNLEIPDGFSCLYSIRIRAEFVTSLSEYFYHDVVIDGAISTTSAGAIDDLYNTKDTVGTSSTTPVFNVSGDASGSPAELILRLTDTAAYDSVRIVGTIRYTLYPNLDP